MGDILLNNAQEINSLNNNTGVPQQLDNRRGVRAMKNMHFKSEIAQRELSDLGRGARLHANHSSRKSLKL